MNDMNAGVMNTFMLQDRITASLSSRDIYKMFNDHRPEKFLLIGDGLRITRFVRAIGFEQPMLRSYHAYFAAGYV